MKFHSKPVSEHTEVPLADEGNLESIVASWQRRAPVATSSETTADAANRCFLVSLCESAEATVQRAQLAELEGLVEAQGDLIVGAQTLVPKRKDPRTFVSAGVAEQIAEAARLADATMLVFDAELSPSQTRNLEDVTGLAVCDREAVILNVFRRHASTKRARLQVELAQLDYLRPRIRGIGLNMDQQMGGSNKARGPGETASELLARRLDKRMADLRRGLAQLKQSDSARRKHRSTASRVVLVGYTNAGKTSLMNALTEAQLSARDRPFETLDTTSRALSRHGGDVLLSDTVGFIRRLPPRLLASFESTLAEVTEASLLLLVVDISDPEAEQHLQTTTALLAKLGAGDVPRLLVFNKCDRAHDADDQARHLANGEPFATVSAHDSARVEALRERVLTLARTDDEERLLFVPYDKSGVVGRLYATCRVTEARAEEGGTSFTVRGSAQNIQRVVHLLEQASS